MARRVKNIDLIAREKKRDVLYIVFNRNVPKEENYADYKYRKELLKWLEDNDIAYEDCLEEACHRTAQNYRGHIYIDIPFNETLDKYHLLNNHIEIEPGKHRFENIVLYYYTLSMAMENLANYDHDFEM